MANITIYWKDGTQNSVPDFDVSGWVAQGWSTSPPSVQPTATTPQTSPSSTSTQRATLTSSDGRYKVVVNVGSQEASQLLSKGWTIGDSGKQLLQLQDALRVQQTSVPVDSSGTKPPEEIAAPVNEEGVNENEQQIQDVSIPIINNGDLPIFVQFSSDPNGPAEGDQATIWLFYPDKKKYVPFTSMQSLLAFTNGITPEQLKATNQMFVLDPSVLTTPQWGAGVPINQLFASPQQGYQSNGLLPDGTTGLEQVKENYGKAVNETTYKNAAFIVDGLITLLKSGNSEISSSTIDKILNDPATLQKYAKALAYGGYSTSDVLRDIKRLDLIAEGNSSLQTVNLISSSLTKQEYQNTSGYTTAVGNPLLTVPTINGLDMSALDLPISQMPEDIFKILVPPLPDPTSPEFRDMMDDIEAAYYDVIDMQINAQTETQKSLAESEWARFKEEIQRKYGILLSNNAIEAWNQIQGIGETYGQRNLTNSGFQNEAIDNYLRGVRRQDQQNRVTRQGEEETRTMEYYQKYASPEEIADLVANNYTNAVKWGLVPSAETKNQFSLESLRSRFPGTPDYLLQRYATSMIDEYGNYRSTLYQNAYSNKMTNLEGKESYQTAKVISDYTTKEEEAYKPYEISGEEDQFSSYQTPTSIATPPVSLAADGGSMPTTFAQVSPQQQPTTPSSGFSTPTNITTPTSYNKYYYYNNDPTKQKIKVTSVQDEQNLKNAGFGIYEGSI